MSAISWFPFGRSFVISEMSLSTGYNLQAKSYKTPDLASGLVRMEDS